MGLAAVWQGLSSNQDLIPAEVMALDMPFVSVTFHLNVGCDENSVLQLAG